VTRSGVSAVVFLLATLLLAACGSSQSGTVVFGGDSGLAGYPDGTVRGPDGSVILPGTDGSTKLPGKDGGAVGPGKDSGSIIPIGDAAPPPPVTACDLCMSAGGTCSATGVCTLSENPGNVSSSVKTQLQGGGSGDSGFKWLYPYDKTVFPRGILGPVLQFGGTAPDAVWVHISFTEMTYDGFFGASSAALGGGSVTLPAATWIAVEAMATASDAVSVQLVKVSGGQVSAPITETWTIAQGEARGTIYYETYDSAILGGIGSVGIMKIQPGAGAPTPVKSGCGNVCHTASEDGSTLVANTVLAFGSASYDLKTNASLIFGAGGEIFTYGGLYPDGTFEMSATNYRTWLNAPSRLYNTTTGANIPAPGWDSTITNAGTASFSPDGKHIAFNHEDKDNGAGHTLTTMDFALANHGFSNLTDIVTDAAHTLAWPAWTPDAKTLIYHSGSSTAFETDNVSDAGVPTTGDVYWVDVASKTSARLDALDGYSPGGTTYLPANDPNLSFAPTILPEAVGGYFWVVFTSHRSYGNTSPSQDNDDINGKLWVSAVNIGATPGTDGSHPAFFLSGQELTSDNLRGFWVLDPCQAAGRACTGGDQCCEGFCRAVGGAYQCVAPPGGCSNDGERCTNAASCCNTQDACINGFCSLPAPH
jgi:hypothetical protein